MLLSKCLLLQVTNYCADNQAIWSHCLQSNLDAISGLEKFQNFNLFYLLQIYSFRVLQTMPHNRD